MSSNIVSLHDATTVAAWNGARSSVQPTLDAASLIQRAHAAVVDDDANWPLDEQEVLQAIPDESLLVAASELCGIAVDEPAPEHACHLAIGAMLASLPSAIAISDEYRRGIVDMLYRDPDGPGPFSLPVLVRVVREVRRTLDAVPSPRRFAEMCSNHRDWFGSRHLEAKNLIGRRRRAIGLPDSESPYRALARRLGYPDDDSDVPF